jgi:hypothetical protein
MADTAAHLVDRVVPAVPVRQWVLTFPVPLRRLLAYDGKLMSAVLACFVRAVTRHYQRRHGPAARTGAVAVIQRFGSALNLNPHIHAGFLDGVYVRPAPGRALRFRPAPPLTDADLEAVMADFQARLRRVLEARGLLRDDPDDDTPEVGPLKQLSLASVSGLPLLGPAPDKVQAASARPGGPRHAPTVQPLCLESAGFTLHARTRIRKRKRGDLEVLFRYLLRPPVASDRVTLRPDGRVELTLPRTWADGTKALTLDPLAFLARLVPLIPAPRRNEVRYHGVLSPHARDRAEVTAGAPAAGGLQRPGTARIRCPLTRETRRRAPDANARRRAAP